MGTGKLLLGAGPYIAYGLGGKWKAKGSNVTVDGKLEFVNDYKDATQQDIFNEDFNYENGLTIPYAKKIDYGANLLAGYELSNNLSFQLNAQLGLANGIPNFDGKKPEKESLKNVGFGISLGYKF